MPKFYTNYGHNDATLTVAESNVLFVAKDVEFAFFEPLIQVVSELVAIIGMHQYQVVVQI